MLEMGTNMGLNKSNLLVKKQQGFRLRGIWALFFPLEQGCR